MDKFLLFFFSTFFTLYGNAQGSELAWAKRIGGNTSATNNVYGPAVVADEQGNSYMAGVVLSGTYKLDGITITKPARTFTGGYIAKYNPNGQIVWAKPLGNISVSSLNTNVLIVDKEGNIYFSAMNARDAASVIGDYYITDGFTETTGNYKTHFISKLDTNGNVLWVKMTDHPNYYGAANELFFDEEGNINMTGGFKNYITFDAGNTLTTDTGEAGVYLAKYSPDGDVLSGKLLEGTYYPISEYEYTGELVRSDASGRLYRWSNKSIKDQDPVLYRYTKEGELIDTKTIHMTSTSNRSQKTVYSNGFSVTPAGDVLIGGYWLGKTLTIEGQNYSGHSTNSDDQAEQSADAFVLKLKASDHTVDWVYLEKSADRDEFTYLLSDGLGNIFATGKYGGDFTELRIRIRKLDVAGQPMWERIINSSVFTQNGQRYISSLAQTRNGGNIWASGYYRENVRFSDDYIFTTPVVTSGSFYNGFLAKYGTCNIPNPVIEEPESTELCEGDNLTLSANISNPALTYFWSTPTGHVPADITGSTAILTISQPGKYYLIAQENAECYGKSQEVWITQVAKPNAGVTKDGTTLTAIENATGTTYQWLDCDNNNYPINGATEQSYTPSVSGSYAVNVTNSNGCSAISECMYVGTLGVENMALSNTVLYPNPADYVLNIETSLNVKTIRIINMAGQNVLKKQNNSKSISVAGLPAGLYIIEITTEQGMWRGKFLKK